MSAHGVAAIVAWDRTVNAAWRELVAPRTSLGTTSIPPVAVPPLPPPNAAPARNAEYWRSLTDEQRRWLVRERPAEVGGRDGFPTEARDRANRMLLRRAKAALEAERAELMRQPTWSPAGVRLKQAQLAEVDGTLHGIEVIEGRLRAPDPDDVEGTGYYLLGFNANGPGDATAIVAHGNPDTAANVATYVPGAESSFASLTRVMNESDAMYESANRFGTNSSVITWLGFDAPDTAVHAISPAYAIDANRSLDRFQQGVDAVNPEAHTTVVGYSYGSVVAGYTARDGGMPADDILAIGSPGMGVSTAAELNVPPERVWVIEANRDPLADSAVHGYDPGDDRFGANQLTADPEGRRATTLGDADDIVRDLADGTLDAHLDYFYNTPSTYPSHYNIGDVIAGRPPSYP